MTVQMIKCCCCIPLKAGVIIISILWVLHGVQMILGSIVGGVFRFYEPFYSGFTLPKIILYALITIGAAFGLFVVTFANTSRMLLIYSKIAYGIVAIKVINCIADIIIISVFGLRICNTLNTHDTSCARYGSILIIMIVITIVAIILTIYFAMVIAAYAQKRKAKEDAGVSSNGYLSPAYSNLPRTLHGQVNGGVPQISYVPQPYYGQINNGLPPAYYVQPQPSYGQINDNLPTDFHGQASDDLSTSNHVQTPEISHHG